MSIPVVITTPESVARPAARVSFWGIMRGEFLKIARLLWWMLGIMAIGFAVAFLLGASSQNDKAYLQQTPLHFLYSVAESNLVLIRILGGIFLLVLTSFVVGREYQYGTIRILLARGAGRVQLLFAKLAVLALIAASLLGVFILFEAALICIQMLTLVGNLNAFSALTPAFWANMGIDLVTVVLSMGATILLATAMNALGRSFTFGLSASLTWFPIDNMGIVVMNALGRLTGSDFWSNVTAYMLGPLLNRLPTMLLPAGVRFGFESFGTGPLVAVSGAHALWVIGAYSLGFLLLALIPTWKRDVRE